MALISKHSNDHQMETFSKKMQTPMIANFPNEKQLP